MPLAAFVCPGTVGFLPVSILSHLSRRVCLECVKGVLRFDRADRNHDVHMVSADVQCVQRPLAMGTDLADRAVHALTLLGIEGIRVRLERTGIELAPAITAREVRRPVTMVKPID